MDTQETGSQFHLPEIEALHIISKRLFAPKRPIDKKQSKTDGKQNHSESDILTSGYHPPNIEPQVYSD
jgi:hypothetical protein